jgi:hypothetical protein
MQSKVLKTVSEPYSLEFTGLQQNNYRITFPLNFTKLQTLKPEYQTHMSYVMQWMCIVHS